MKKKFLLFILFLIVIFYLSFSNIIFAKNEGFVKNLRDNTPQSIKNFLKDTIFVIPSIKKKNLILERDLASLKESLYKQQLSIEALQNKLNSELITYNDTLITKNKKLYNLKKISLPFYNLNNPYKNKKQGYLLVIEKNLYIFFWSGKIIRINIDQLHNGEIKFSNVENNLDQFLIDHQFKWVGIKDAISYKNEIYLSYTNKIKENCYSVGVLKSKKNYKLENIRFENFFSFEECVNIENSDKFSNRKYFGGFQAGGRMDFKNNFLFLTVGDYRNWALPQDENSNFGKILKIDLATSEYEKLSKGHRNPQGLFIINDDYILSTEHGPKGGDEINLIKTKNISGIQNFGWPIASYGEHYNSVSANYKVRKIAPMHKSHIKYGFIEPVKNFTPSLGISQIEKSNKDNNAVFVSSLKTMEVLEYDINIINEELILKDNLKFDERIRDIIYHENKNLHYIFFESEPSLGILEKK